MYYLNMKAVLREMLNPPVVLMTEVQDYVFEFHYSSGNKNRKTERMTLNDAILHTLRMFSHTGFRVVSITLYDEANNQLMRVDETSLVTNFSKGNE